MENAPKPFYMIFVEGGNSPNHKHETLESAEAEAKRLATLLRKKAFILCSIKSIELDVFKIEDLRPENNDLPF